MDAAMTVRSRGVLEGPNKAATMDHQQQKIPIWIGSECKVLSGVNKTTTCAEIIHVLVAADEDPSKFVIVEKWRKMERKLESGARILKVWREWGDQKNEVALILRQHHSSSTATTCPNGATNDGYIDKRGSSNRTFRRRSSTSHHKAGCAAVPTAATSTAPNANHVERGGEEAGMTESMERILSLVLTQGETIQVQLKKLRHQEEQIERFEEQMHRIRSLKDGDNYVVASYLNEDLGTGGPNATSSKGLFGLGRSATSSLRRRDKNSKKLMGKSKCETHKTSAGGSKKRGGKGVIDGCRLLEQFSPKVQSVEDIIESTDADPTASFAESLLNSETLMQQNELMERICQVNGELTKEEERLVKLGLKLKKYQQQSASANKDEDEDSSEDEDDRMKDANCQSRQRESEQQKFASQLSLELESLRKITTGQSCEIEQNEAHLTEIETMLDEKHDCILHLTYEIQLLDVESDLLQQRLLQITKTSEQQSPPSSTQVGQQQPQPPPYEQAINSSMLANYLLPYNYAIDATVDHSNNDEDTRVADVGESNSARLVPPPDASDTSRAVPTLLQSCPTRTLSLQAVAVPKVVPSCNCNCDASYCQCRGNNSSTTSRSTAELSLQSSSRDHQDNDSNSDTGISSLHSSGDENTLFTLDTLV